MKQCVPFLLIRGDESEQKCRHPIRNKDAFARCDRRQRAYRRFEIYRSVVVLPFPQFSSGEKQRTAAKNEHFGEEFQGSVEIDPMVCPFSSENPDTFLRALLGLLEGTLYRSSNQSFLDRLFKRMQDVLRETKIATHLPKSNMRINSMAYF